MFLESRSGGWLLGGGFVLGGGRGRGEDKGEDKGEGVGCRAWGWGQEEGV